MKVTSFFDVMEERAKAAHDGICPRVQFVEPAVAQSTTDAASKTLE